MFEITVKALASAARKLQNKGPDQAAGAVPPPAADSPGEPATASPPALGTPSGPEPAENAGTGKSELAGDLSVRAPEFLAVTRKMLEAVSDVADEAQRQKDLGEIHRRIQTLATRAKLDQLSFAAQTGSVVETFLKRMCQNPKMVTASTLSTVENALLLIEQLCGRAIQQQLAHYPPIRLLVVEDDPVTRRAVAGTLQMNFEKPDTARDGAEALEQAQAKIYDVIFSDIEMPNMGGFGLCARLREGGPNRDTPIIFITTHNNAEARKQAMESGGSDFIGKPFLPIELTVKAYTFALGTRIRNWIPIDLWPSSPSDCANPEPGPQP